MPEGCNLLIIKRLLMELLRRFAPRNDRKLLKSGVFVQTLICIRWLLISRLADLFHIIFTDTWLTFTSLQKFSSIHLIHQEKLLDCIFDPFAPALDVCLPGKKTFPVKGHVLPGIYKN